jgi:hypothetical protein
MAENDDLSPDWPPEDDAAARPPKSVWPSPTQPEPDTIAIADMVMGVVDCEATDGCVIEPDGVCEHGHPSWLLRLGLI